MSEVGRATEMQLEAVNHALRKRKSLPLTLPKSGPMDDAIKSELQSSIQKHGRKEMGDPP